MSTVVSDHGSVRDTFESELTGSVGDSQYCYMFPELAKAEFERPRDSCVRYFETLGSLAREVESQPPFSRNKKFLPAIYTYFGQFINHDISAPMATPDYRNVVVDKASKGPHSGDIEAAGPDAVALLTDERPPNPEWLIKNIRNQHRRPLCLNSLYGAGPKMGSRQIQDLYDQEGLKFRIGETFDDPAFPLPQGEPLMLRHDLVRSADAQVAKIADRRNDENLVLSQLHLAFMLFHNRAIDVLRKQKLDQAELFKQARREVTLHYQYCVVHDYLKHLVPDETLGVNLPLTGPIRVPFEFTTAAFRFGHSMVSEQYDYNRFFGIDDPDGNMATLKDLFDFTSRGNMGRNRDNPARGDGQLPTHWVIDWARFVRETNNKISSAEGIDTAIPGTMIHLPDTIGNVKIAHGLTSICHRNLKRGYHRFMPSGQQLAEKLGFTPLGPDRIRGAFTNESSRTVLKETGLDKHTPAWVYFLCEASLEDGGAILGPAAGAIVRGTIMSLLRRNPESALAFDGGRWTPEQSPLRLANGGTVKDIKSFLQFAGVL